MTKEEIGEKLKALSNQSESPSLSIFFPVNTDDVKFQYKLDRVVAEARSKLNEVEDREKAKQVEEKLKTLMADPNNMVSGCRGMGVFVSPSIAETVCLPFTIDQNVVLDETFHIRDLVFALNRLEEYLVLSLSEKKILTLRGSSDQLSVIQIPDMPLNISELGEYTDDRRYAGNSANGTNHGPGDSFIHTGMQEDDTEKLRYYIVKIDQALTKFFQHEGQGLRLVLTGVDKKLGYFNKFSKNTDKIIGTVVGNYDHLPSQELGKLAWEAVQEKFSEEKEAVLDQLQNAIGQHLYVSGIQEVWKAAVEGRVRTLVVEQGYQCKAVLKDDGYTIELNTDNAQAPVKEDAVDDLIELVMSKGGNVVFADNGKLEGHQQLAAITRY